MSDRNDAFRQGVSPGGMFTKDDVRLLLCCLLTDLGRPVAKDVVVSGLFGCGLANYFELGSAVEALIENGALAVVDGADGAQLLTIAPRGRNAAETLADGLPKTVRQKALEGVRYFEQAEKQRRENTVEVRPTDAGLAVTLHSGTPQDRLMSLTVYAPNGELADVLKKKMSAAPVEICERIFKILLEE